MRFIGTEHEKEACEIYENAEKFMGQAMKNIGEGYKVFEAELRNQKGQIRAEMKKDE